MKDVKRYFDYSLDVFQKQSVVNQVRFVTTALYLMPKAGEDLVLV